MTAPHPQAGRNNSAPALHVLHGDKKIEQEAKRFRFLCTWMSDIAENGGLIQVVGLLFSTMKNMKGGRGFVWGLFFLERHLHLRS